MKLHRTPLGRDEREAQGLRSPDLISLWACFCTGTDGWIAAARGETRAGQRASPDLVPAQGPEKIASAQCTSPVVYLRAFWVVRGVSRS